MKATLARGGEALSATVAEKKADTAATCAPAETTQVAAAPSGVTTTYPAGTKLSLPDSDAAHSGSERVC